MKYSILIFTVLLAVSQVANAQVADTLDLGEVVITASKTPTTERETTKPVTIIDQQEIQRNPGASVAEILNQQNGLMINGAISSPGKDKSVYLRGAATQYTLILVDGYPVTDPSGVGGAFDLRLLSLENVQRIEIVKGSMSTLYGSDAIAGVINIITKEPSKNTFQLNGKAAYGSFDTNELSLGTSGTTNVGEYTFNITRDFTKGISEAATVDGTDFERDGFERISTSAELKVEPFSGFDITPFINYSTFDGDYDAGAFVDADNQYKAELVNTGARLSFERGPLKIREALTLTKTERKFVDAYGVFNPEARLLNSDLYATFDHLDAIRILAGFNIQDLEFESGGIDEGSTILSPYLTAYIESGTGLNAELGIRLNNHSEYGSNWTFNIAPVYNLNDNIKLLTSVSSGFKAPTLNELFGPFGANTDLAPQQSLTIDGGIEYRAFNTGFSFSAIYFQRKIEDLISYDSNLGFINVSEQNDSGIELKVNYTLPRFRTEVFYNYLDGAISQNGEKEDNLIRRPDHAFGMSISGDITKNWGFDFYSSYVGKREDLYFNMNSFQNESKILDPYVLVNIGSKYSLADQFITIFADLNNVLDSDYSEVYGFNTPGMHFKAGLIFKY